MAQRDRSDKKLRSVWLLSTALLWLSGVGQRRMELEGLEGFLCPEFKSRSRYREGYSYASAEQDLVTQPSDSAIDSGSRGPAMRS